MINIYVSIGCVVGLLVVTVLNLSGTLETALRLCANVVRRWGNYRDANEGASYF